MNGDVICLPSSSESFLNIYTNRGVSEDAVQLQNRVSEASRYLFQNVTFGEPLMKTFESLEAVYEECSVNNWDGYGAKAIDLNSYYEAIRFIEILPITIPLPEITAEPDGEVAFEWYNGPRRIFSVSIGSINNLTYAGLFGSRKTHGTEYFVDEIPKTILDNIKRVFS